jgi:hypothetical protein
LVPNSGFNKQTKVCNRRGKVSTLLPPNSNPLSSCKIEKNRKNIPVNNLHKVHVTGVYSPLKPTLSYPPSILVLFILVDFFMII